MRLARLCSPACALGVLLLACQAPMSSKDSEDDPAAAGVVAAADPRAPDDEPPARRDDPRSAWTELGGDGVLAAPTTGAGAGDSGGAADGGDVTDGAVVADGGDAGEAGVDASKPPACPASSYEMTLKRSLSVVVSYATNPLGRGVVNTTGTLRLWRPNSAVYPNAYYFNLKIPGESGSNFTLVSWSPATISGTGMSFSFGGSTGISDANTFPFTGCYSGARDRNKGSMVFDNKAGTVSLSVSCSHWVQTGPLLKDQQIEITTWSGKGVGACVAPP